MAAQGDVILVERAKLREQLNASYLLAVAGVVAQTVGPTKLASRQLVEKARKAQVTHASRIGTNHKEDVAILVVDMRGSTQLAQEHDAEGMFILMQCFLPLLTLVAHHCEGEIVGLRGDGIIAAFGFDEKVWRPCVNRAYEAGMIMIEASRDLLAPFLRKNGHPTPNAVGASVDGGTVTMTKIGLGETVEVTAYGDAVNSAAKACKGHDELFISAAMNRHLHHVSSPKTYTQKRSRLIGR